MKPVKILHLANDEKFIDMGVASFERAFPGCNDLYVRSNHKLKHVKLTPKKIIGRFKAIFGLCKKDFQGYDVVVLHFLHPKWFRAILKIPKEIPVVWIGWGADYYDLVYPNRESMLLEKTKKIIHSLKAKKKGSFKDLFQPKKETVIDRIDYFSPVLPEEYELVKSHARSNRFPKQCFWNYGNLEDNYIKGLPDTWTEGNSILLGNSASDTNNHPDAFDFLKTDSARKLVIPLSYGNMDYRKSVIREAQEIFGDNAICLTKFMPLQEYLKLICNCGYVVMNHVRQQGLGNIISMLYLGSKVFLREENPIYAYLKDEGVIVFKITDLSSNPQLLNTPLSNAEREINRSIIIKNWSKITSDSKTAALINAAIANKVEV